MLNGTELYLVLGIYFNMITFLYMKIINMQQKSNNTYTTKNGLNAWD